MENILISNHLNGNLEGHNNIYKRIQMTIPNLMKEILLRKCSEDLKVTYFQSKQQAAISYLDSHLITLKNIWNNIKTLIMKKSRKIKLKLSLLKNQSLRRLSFQWELYQSELNFKPQREDDLSLKNNIFFSPESI